MRASKAEEDINNAPTMSGRDDWLGPTTGSKLRVRKLNDNALVPVRASKYSAGVDLFASKDMTVKNGSRCLVSTDIAVAMPEGTYGRIAPRSGLAHRYGLHVGAGVIDGDYRGEVKVLLFNHGSQDFDVKVGDRIAQLITEK